jgi:hypothetical protein
MWTPRKVRLAERPGLLPVHPRSPHRGRGSLAGARSRNDNAASEGSMMMLDGIAQAMRRVEAVLQRWPEVGAHDDSPAVSTWKAGTQVIASHPNGTQVLSDMPGEFGGGGAHVTPGWLLRAGTGQRTRQREQEGSAGGAREVSPAA